jgi:dephospho-CoA kinase
MKIIGLAGGIGSGKSTVAKFLAERGAVIVDLDKLGHEALKQKEVREQLVKEFGKGILGSDGDIDRAAIGRLVFNSPEALARLNRIVHPVIDAMVERKISDYRRRGAGVVVLEAAAMVEAGRAWQVDELWVTVAPEEVVLKRLTEDKGYAETEAKARIRSQMPHEERVKQADVVIDTDCTLDELKARVAAEWERLLERT